MLHFSASKKTINTLLGLCLLLVTAIVVFPKHAAAYTNSPLISDSNFLNASTMNPDQIQTFLTTKGSALAGMYVTESSATETLSYYPHYNQSVRVSQAIYDAAQVYGINPQVIMATMQKEQSLITDPAPSSSQLRFAMGYGCPDSAGCNDTAAGLFYQIDNGTWDLRFLRERANGNNTWWRASIAYPCANAPTTPIKYYSAGLFPGNNVTFSDDNGTPYATFVISNPATASMYCYTPHAYNNPNGLFGNPVYGTTGLYYSGSYNFVTAYQNWFGPLTAVSVTGSPGSVSWGSSRIDTFVRGSDGNLWQKYYDGNNGGWGPWAALNVPLISSPTVSSWGVGRLDIFYVDSSGNLNHYWYGNGAWQNIESLGQPPGVLIASDPSVVSWGSGRIDVFARGNDDSLWQKTYDGPNDWLAWVKIGGGIHTSPAASTTGVGELNIFATGIAGDLMHFWFAHGAWNDPESLGTPSSNVKLSTAPGAVSWGTARIDAFGRGSDGVLWQKWFDKNGWHPWERFTGVLRSAPSISSWAPERLDEFSTGPAGDLQHFWFGGYWGNWESFGQPAY